LLDQSAETAANLLALLLVGANVASVDIASFEKLEHVVVVVASNLVVAGSRALLDRPEVGEIAGNGCVAVGFWSLFLRSFIAAVSLDGVLLLASFDHFCGHFNDAVVFVSRAVLELDWAEKIVESASWIALNAAVVAPGVLALVAF